MTLKAKDLNHQLSSHWTKLNFCQNKHSQWEEVKVKCGTKTLTMLSKLNPKNTHPQRVKAQRNRGVAVPRAAWRQGTAWWAQSVAGHFRSPVLLLCVECVSACLLDEPWTTRPTRNILLLLNLLQHFAWKSCHYSKKIKWSNIWENM